MHKCVSVWQCAQSDFYYYCLCSIPSLHSLYSNCCDVLCSVYNDCLFGGCCNYHVEDGWLLILLRINTCKSAHKHILLTNWLPYRWFMRMNCLFFAILSSINRFTRIQCNYCTYRTKRPIKGTSIEMGI